MLDTTSKSVINEALGLSLDQVAEILPEIWCQESSAFPTEWTPENPACGQCWCSAWLVHHLFGGDIIAQKLRFTDGVYDHFVNEIKGARYDLSASQMEGEAFDIVSERVFTKNQLRFSRFWPPFRDPVDIIRASFEKFTGVALAVQ